MLGLLLLILSSAVSSDKGCIKGDIQYSIADYKEKFKPEYARLFHSWFHKPLLHFLCQEDIKNLPILDKNKRGKTTPSKQYIIEPLFVELTTFNGLYAKRTFSLEPNARNPRFTCGFFHSLFIISDKEYIELTDDSLVNATLVQNKLGQSFTAQEIQQMKPYYQDDQLCDPLSFLPPLYVKKGDSIVYDDSKD